MLVRRFHLILILCATALAGCASAPAFRPSKPVELARSLPESLLLCNEYRPPDESRDRPISLKPFVACVRDTEERFPGESISVFSQELGFQYRLLREETFSRSEGRRLEVAIRAALLAQGGSSELSVSEWEELREHFPRTARGLRDLVQLVKNPLPRHAGLDELKAALASMRQSSTAGDYDPAQCRDWNALVQRVNYLNAFWADICDMARMGAVDPQTLRTHRTRFDSSLKNAQAALDGFREAMRIGEGGKFAAAACTPLRKGESAIDARSH